MKSHRSPWILLVWPASLIAALLILWISGYLYWQVRISRAIAELQREPTKFSSRNSDLLDIGSRGFPRLIRELDDALARGDQVQAVAFFCGCQDLFAGAHRDDGKGAVNRADVSMEYMRKDCKELQTNWPEFQRLFAPWWMWWSGKRRAP
jgi:hypothetical protein